MFTHEGKIKMFDILVIAVGVSMDAFAVSVCKGLTMKKLDMKKALIIGAYFGFFQAFMPLVGYFLGSSFESLVTSIDHWIAFVLLSFIGGNLIKEAISGEGENVTDGVGFKEMLMLAIATSIDALAVGVTFAFLRMNIWLSVSLIGVTTFCFSVAGVALGNRFGKQLGNRAQLAGGVILIFIGIKILLEHLGII